MELLKTKTIDLHTHILPRMDDGAETSEVSVEQLRILADAGVEKIVATPHFYPQSDTVERFLLRRKASAERLLQVAGDEERPLEIYLGAEVLVCPGIDHMPDLRKLCIEGTNVILLEMPFSNWREEYFEAVRKISKDGYTVVIAHIERYPAENALKLYRECPKVLFQLNGGASEFRNRKKFQTILKSLPVVAIGSDIHSANDRTAKKLRKLSVMLSKRNVNVYEMSKELLSSAVSL